MSFLSAEDGEVDKEKGPASLFPGNPRREPKPSYLLYWDIVLNKIMEITEQN